MTLSPAHFQAFRDLAYREAGISLRDGKEELVATRVARRMRELGIPDLPGYLAYLQNDASGDELVKFIDVISTNFTSFYREPAHFEMLTREANEWADGGARRVRLWCAAAATGEEPWTLAVTLAEALNARNIDWKILATDISTRALAAAQEARYRAHQLSSVAPAVRNRYFEATPDEAGADKMVRVRQELRASVMFRRLNLAKPPFPLRGGLDAVFCRNVMIYFDQPVRQALISEIERLLKPGGLLFIGHSETLNGVRSKFTMIDPAVYRKGGGP